MSDAEDSPEVHEAEPEEQHEGGEDEPTVDELQRQVITQRPLTAGGPADRRASRGRSHTAFPFSVQGTKRRSGRSRPRLGSCDSPPRPPGPRPVCACVKWFPWKPAHLVAAVFVEDHQEDGHDHDDADHDDGVEDGVEEPAAHRRGVLSEGRVDPAGRTSVSAALSPRVKGQRGTYSCWLLFSE